MKVSSKSIERIQTENINENNTLKRNSKNKEINIKININPRNVNSNPTKNTESKSPLKKVEEEPEPEHDFRNAIRKDNSYNNQYSIEEEEEVSNDGEHEDNIFDILNKDAGLEQFKIDEKNFDEIMNKNISANKLKDYFEPCLYNSNNNELKFKPEINENSKNIVKNKKLNETKQLNKSSDNLAVGNRVEDELYVDALNRRKKKELIEENNIMGILLNANKTKISNNSHRIALQRIEKYVEDVVNKVDKEGTNKLSFTKLGIILTDLKIFREIINKDDKKSSIKEYATYKDIKMELNNLRDNEKRKKQEVDFYEQFWFKLNPDNKDFINIEVLQEFIKILLSPSSSTVKEISSVLTQFLQAAFFLVNANSEERIYISPITQKLVPTENIWDIEKFTKEFLNLKINILAYITTNNPSKTLQQEIEKEKKNNCFHPKLNKKKDEKENKESKGGKFYEERLKSILEREKIKSEVYSQAKKELEENKFKECTFKPQINKKKIECPLDNSNPKPIHEKLFKIHQEKIEKLERIQNDNKKLKEFDETKKFSFKPQFVADYKNVEKSRYVDKPKGFDETVERMRNGIVEKYRKKYLLEKIPVGDNYEKIKNANIQPFNITDLSKLDEETASSQTRKDREDEDFFSMDINVAKGKMRQLKVYRSDNPQEIAENFCRIYGLKKEIADRLSKTIQEYMNLYLNQDHPEETNEENKEY